MKAKLLRGMVERLEPRAKPYDVYDAALAGFAVRVHPGGAKAYIARYRPKGGGRAVNPRTHTIGRHPAITPEQARDQARSLLADVAAGKDPTDRIEVNRSVSAILDEYLAYLAGRPGWRVAKGDVKLHLGPAFGHLLPREVTPQRIRKFYNQLEEAGHDMRASACLSTLRTAFKRAGLEPPSLGTVKLASWTQRERIATREELTAVLMVCSDMLRNGREWPWPVYMILLLILTGARPSEIRTAKWSDIDLARGVLVRQEHKTKRKTKKPREIELSPAACEIIARMPGIDGNPYLIPGQKPGACLVNYDTTWCQVRKLAGVPDLWVYDLRRTFTSMGLGRGFTLDQLGKALGHSHSATTAGYAWLLPNEKKRIATEVGVEIAGLLPELLASSRHAPGDTGLSDPA